jgi:hypothetical protein
MTDGVFSITTGKQVNHVEDSIDTDIVAMQISQINELIAAIES